MYLYNSPEYCETNFAAMKIRGIPINVNYRYLDDELAYLLDNADMEALVFHSSLGDRVARVRDAACRACGCWSRSTTVRRPTARRTSRARYATRTIQRTLAPAARIEPQRRRDLHVLHRRHDRHAEGRDVLDAGLHRRSS